MKSMGKALGVVITIAVFVVIGFGLVSCGKTVEPGNAGVKIRTLGAGAGVDPQPLSSGWHFKGVGERIVEFPVIQRTYSYTREADERGPENEEIAFADNTGLPMTADVAITLQVNPASAPNLYKTYRLSFDQLLDGPIRNDVRSAIAAETERVNVDQLYSGGRQQVIQRAMARVSAKWARYGVQISQLEWIGTIRYPEVILNAIQAKTRTEQETLTARAQVAKAQAQAEAQIAAARGQAESIRIINEALAANPRYVELKAVEKWDGKLPQVTGSATPFVSVPQGR
ncbi:MAG TPA: SPFH domain-containing protein [Caulobacteraceae bacterium]|nr:SPFH domain-containing protein [Caulobacteraceae bacterium]